MDKNYLDKVVSQIVSETTIDGKVHTPYPPFRSTYYAFFVYSPPDTFFNHCKEVYGLNEEETKYVWNNYRDIVKDKIDNNG